MTGSGCCPGRGAGWNAIRRCATRWAGPTTCSTTTNGRVLDRCSVFADGFDLAAATHICGGGLDEYAVLDLLGFAGAQVARHRRADRGHARYGMLETIRQFAEDQLAATGTIDEVRDRHARYFAEQAVAHWDLWNGPRQRVAVDWVDVEFANLRAGFRWAADQGDLATAAAIAAHTTLLTFALQRFEPIGWAEEILEAAAAADLPQLPRLYTAASLCSFTGRAEAAVGYAQTRGRVGGRSPLRPLRNRMEQPLGGAAHLYAGRVDRYLEICAASPPSPGPRTSSVLRDDMMLPMVGRAEEARAIAEETLAAARAHGNPFLIAYALRRVRAGLHRDRSRPGPGRLATGARLRPGAPTPVLGGEPRTRCRPPRSGSRRARAGPGVVRHRHRRVPPAGNVADLALTLRQPGRVLRPHRTTRDRRHRLRRQHALVSTIMVTDLPGVVDHLRAVLGGRAFRRVRRHRRRHGTRRRRALRPTADPTRPQPTPSRHMTGTSNPSAGHRRRAGNAGLRAQSSGEFALACGGAPVRCVLVATLGGDAGIRPGFLRCGR